GPNTGSIHGVVADVVRAPEQLEVAVEAVLGDRLGGVLVSEPEVGIAAVGFLKAGGGGRSAFVPLRNAGVIPAITSTSSLVMSDMDPIELDDRSALPRRLAPPGR
ncbi:MAG TPA: hypothetical protein VHT91_23765, partial [Kofleriaceae bacterium]|nr:hypothetical protein [Kofleriaceae bacterium]